MKSRSWVAAVLAAAVCTAPLGLQNNLLRADAPAPAAPKAEPTGTEPNLQKIDYTEETLPNGLKVIYAPLHNAPVCQVRVLYHVGSRDERPDRQGFAHMFEHMMFRGSAHVKPQEHMHLVDEVGGICNAFTSFDQTVYHDTLPSEDLEMALYLEADRMASFKVSDEIYQTERKVVAEEWRMKNNKPYGNLFDDYLKTAFTTHSYKWTPIGNMQHLLAAPASELQDFFNTYYVPNNAVLVLSGDIDVAKSQEMVHKYFGWIPKGAEITRLAKTEPPQTESRSVKVPDRVPLPAVIVGYHLPQYKSDDTYALSVLSYVLGEGESSRLHKLLVGGEKPMCYGASTLMEQLEDGGIFGAEAIILPGNDSAVVKTKLLEAVADVVKNGITPDELAKAKTARRVEMIHGRETCEDLASQLGDEELFAGDASRVNSDMAKLDAVTADAVKAVAAKYCQPEMETDLTVVPDPTGVQAKKAAAEAMNKITKGDAPVAASTEPIHTRDIQFPAGYPEKPPIADPKSAASFVKGTESTVNGVKVIVMRDNRLPVVNWSLTMRRGSNNEPVAKQGVAELTTEMMTHGTKDMTYQQFNDTCAAHGISVGVGAGGDTTSLGGSCTTDELDRGIALSRAVLMTPTFPKDEFDKVKTQTLAGLKSAMDNAGTVAGQEMSTALYGESPMGRHATTATVNSVTLDDVKKCYDEMIRPDDAILVISGDVTIEKGQELAKQLTDGWTPKPTTDVDYTTPAPATGRHIILVDRPGGAGATIRIGIPAYDIHDFDEKFAGSLAGTILSSGIESRLMEYVRAEKGYCYDVRATFSPGRHGGAFTGSTETKLENAGVAVEAIFKVLDDMRDGKNPITPEQLADAKRRVAGSMVMGMQTISSQAGMRSDGILNGYPIDYYDKYADHIAGITTEQIQAVMKKYVKTDDMTIVVVAPAADVKAQLEKLGPVTVLPMPALREAGPTSKPGDELMK